MFKLKNLNFNNCIGTHTLLYGETNTFKTHYTAFFVQFLLENKKINAKEITILDFAPKLKTFNDIKIGGRIEDFYERSLSCRYILLENEIIPPRINAKNKVELYKNAQHNYRLTSEALKQYQESPTSFLIINDISIYLHLGNKNYLTNIITKIPDTFFGNTYYGNIITKPFAKLFSLKERKRVQYLLRKVENVYKMEQNR
ncbi:MAG: hypothetical protein ACTSUN_07395 [Promethearchaeota archaeon]